MAVFDLKKATVKIKDAGSNNVTIKVGEGTLSYTEKRNRNYVKDRGILSTVLEGDEEPLDVKFDLIWEFISSTGSEPVTPVEALKQKGAAAAWVTTDSDTCQPYAVDIEIVFDLGCDADIETITLPLFRIEQLDYNLKSGMLSVSGKCNATVATAVRS